jgi:acyl-CoA synthetase (NDP forming)
MSPAEDALLLLRLAERHLGSLRGTLDPGSFAEEDWGFLAQQTLEKLLKALLVLHCQGHPAAIRCNVCCRSSPAAAKPWASLQSYWS